MNIVSLNEILPLAREKGIAVPQFNINGFQWIEAIVEVVEKNKLPVIIAVTDRNVDRLGGYRLIAKQIKMMIDERDIKSNVVIHLDHGQSVENCIKAIDAGFSSVMYDGSREALEINIQNSKKVTEYAHRYNVSVEGEIGKIGGKEDGISGKIVFADPQDCRRLVSESNLDALAPALGSVHGEYVGEPNLQFDIMNTINRLLEVPLVLHGASGISAKDLQKAINLGHAKINFNTELNKSWAKSLKNIFYKEPNIYDPAEILSLSKQGLIEVIENKMLICNNGQYSTKENLDD